MLRARGAHPRVVQLDMIIEDSFHVDAPLHRTWPVLNDFPRVAACIPNAQVTDAVDERTYRGKVSLRFGPVEVSYRGTVLIGMVDEDARSAVFHVRGDDSRGQGGVWATVVTRAEAAGHKTRISMRTEAQISGVVATVGSLLIKRVAKNTLARFAENLAAIA